MSTRAIYSILATAGAFTSSCKSINKDLSSPEDQAYHQAELQMVSASHISCAAENIIIKSYCENQGGKTWVAESPDGTWLCSENCLGNHYFSGCTPHAVGHHNRNRK